MALSDVSLRMKKISIFQLLLLFVFSIKVTAQIGADGTGTVNGYYVGPDANLSGSPPKALISGYYHNMVITEEGDCLAWGWGIYGQTAVEEDLSDIISVDGGYYHSLAVDQAGVVYAWGRNNYSQTTIPEIDAPAVQVASGYTHSLVLTEDGNVVGFGRDNKGQSTVPDGLSTVSYTHLRAHETREDRVFRLVL